MKKAVGDYMGYNSWSWSLADNARKRCVVCGLEEDQQRPGWARWIDNWRVYSISWMPLACSVNVPCRRSSDLFRQREVGFVTRGNPVAPRQIKPQQLVQHNATAIEGVVVVV